jgi:2-polyprenyl-6-hydroxyphenyl methylase/3-demethylubiquinone-9 3-methyltransferase
MTAATSELNVDPEEIAKFEALASRWWDPESEFKPLHDINPLRLGFIEEHCGGLQGKTAVDVGCGGGILSESMARQGATVTGIDMGEAPLTVAQLHAMDAGFDVDYQKIPAEAFAEQHAGKFDVVTCMEMLEHVPDPSSIIKACQKMLKPDGKVFFSTLNRNPKSYLFAIVGAEHILKLLPKGTHDYKKFITPAELSRFIRQANLQMDDLKGMSYNPIFKSYKLSQDVSVNYLIAAQNIN